MHAEVKRKLIEIKPIHKYYLNNFNLRGWYLLSGGPLEIEGEGGGGGGQFCQPGYCFLLIT